MIIKATQHSLAIISMVEEIKWKILHLIFNTCSICYRSEGPC